MRKLTPLIYLLGIFFVVFLAWFGGVDERLANIVWSLPGLFVGTFTILWNVVDKLESRITRLEKEIEKLKDGR